MCSQRWARLESPPIINVDILWRKNIIFQSREKSHFLIFFPSVKCFFPVEIFILVHPKQIISVVSKSDKQKRKKEKKCSFSYLCPFHVKFSSSPFTFSLLFLFFSLFSLASLPLFSLSLLFPHLASLFPLFPLLSQIFPKLSKSGRLAHLTPNPSYATGF